MHDPAPTLQHYLAVMRRQAWLIAVTVSLAVTAAVVVVNLMDPVYRATSKIVVGQGGGVFQPQFGNTVEPFTQTMTHLLESDVVATQVIERLDLDTTPKELLEDLTVTSRPESSVLDVSYESKDTEEAIAVLEQVGIVFTETIDERLGAATGGVNAQGGAIAPITARVFDPAHLQPDPVSPKPLRAIGLAGLLGVVLGVVLAFVRESLDDRIRGERDARTALRAPVIGSLPKGMRSVASAYRLGSHRASKALEALSLLRANIEFSQAGLTGPTTLVTSALPEEGKSTVAASLAASLAIAGHDVICVEADLRRPMLHEQFAVRPGGGRGLVDVVEGKKDLELCLYEVPLVSFKATQNGHSAFAGRNRRSRVATLTGADSHLSRGRLRVLFSGQLEGDPSHLLTAERVDDLIGQLRGLGEFVIVDTPPMLLVGDAFPLVRAVDNIVAVVREGHTTRRSAEALRATLDALGGRNVSVVLTYASSAVEHGSYGYRSKDALPERELI